MPESTKNNINLKKVIKKFLHEIFSLLLIILMLNMPVIEAVGKYNHKPNHYMRDMIKYFDVIGRVMLVFVILSVIVKIFKNGFGSIKTYFSQNKFDILLIIFLIYSFVAALLSDNRNTAFVGHENRHAGFKTYLIYAAAYVCGKYISYIKENHTESENPSDNKIYQKNIIKFCFYFSFMIVCSFQNILPIKHYLGYNYAKEGAFYNLNHSAYFMTMSIFAIIGFISLSRGIVLKLLGIGLYAVNVWCLIINNTLGCYLAVIAGMIFMSVIYFIKYKKPGITIIISIALFIAISIVVEHDSHIISQNFRVLANDTDNISSGNAYAGSAGSGRWHLWVAGFEYAKMHPLLGCGPDCMPIDTDTGRPLMLVHNEYLQYAMEIGTPALVCYIAGLLMILMKRLKTLKTTDESVIYDCSAVFGYCISAFFGINIFYTAIYYFIFLGMTSANYHD